MTALLLAAGPLGDRVSAADPAAMTAPARRWTAAIALGGSHAFPTSLRIRQEGEPELSLRAHYATRPLETPLYYAARLARWRSGRAWEVELVHQKLFLTNPPSEVQAFAISHGYNLITLNRAWEWHGLVARLGAGGVLVHPETRVRGQVLPNGGGLFGKGYWLSGPALQTGIGREWAVSPRLFAHLEGKLTLSHARVPVAEGQASVSSVALHALVGFGRSFHH